MMRAILKASPTLVKLWMILGLMLATGLATYRYAAYRYQAQISSLKADFALQNEARIKQHNQALQAALMEQQKWHDFAQHQSAQLAQAQQQLDIQAAKQHKEISDVIQKDNSGSVTYNGMGNDSLQHYKRAFGYHN